MPTRTMQYAAIVAAIMFVADAAFAEAPPPTIVTPEMIAAAKEEGKVVWYTSVELETAEHVAEGFKAKYPGIEVQVERSGAERNFQRLTQEYGSGIHVADTVNSSDAAH